MTLTEKLRELRKIKVHDVIKQEDFEMLLDIIEVQREALKMVIAQSGLPDPGDACRAAIKTAKEALEKAESMVRG